MLQPLELADLIEGKLKKYGNGGSNRKKFCIAVATGIVMSIVGKPFATQDIGAVAGAGQGNGMGIKGLQYDAMTSLALQTMPTRGENAKKLMDAIMEATKEHLEAKATLKSVHAPVFVGTGKVVAGSILVLIPEMAKNIDDQLMAGGAEGTNRMPLSLAVSTGVCTEIIKNGTGQVIIIGSPAGIPAPGGGVGVGVIT